jgi:hypothetical protein
MAIQRKTFNKVKKKIIFLKYHLLFFQVPKHRGPNLFSLLFFLCWLVGWVVCWLVGVCCLFVCLLVCLFIGLLVCGVVVFSVYTIPYLL